MPFKFSHKEIPEVMVIESTAFPDDRGYFEEIFKLSDFKKNGIDFNFVQDNHSFSRKGVVRGMHFQNKPHEQGKIVYVTDGRIFDVAVDIRPRSGTFGKWVYEELSMKNHRMLWIPPGFAHGFMALEDSHVIYKTTEEYDRRSESGIIWNDPDLAIEWPLRDAVVSEKDRKLKRFSDLRAEMDRDLN